MSGNNNQQPPQGEGSPSLPAMAAARAALAHANASLGADLHASGNVAGGVPDALRSQGSNIIANRSNSPPTSRASHRTPPPLALRGAKARLLDGAKEGRGAEGGGKYPLPANCDFVPGGIEMRPASIVAKEVTGQIEMTEDRIVYLGKYCTASGTTSGAGAATSPRPGASPRIPRPRGRGLSISTGSEDTQGPEVIVRRALMADASLRKFVIQFAQNAAPGAKNPGQRLPSLSHLAHSALVNPLTSVPANGAVEWAESMIMEYMDSRYEEDGKRKRVSTLTEQCGTYEVFENVCQDPATGQELPHLDEASSKASNLLRRAMLSAWAEEEAATGRTPTNANKVSDIPLSDALTMPPPSLGGLLKALWKGQRGEPLLPSEATGNGSGGGCCAFEGGPCGYVFRRGDIAWNCRTCQTDATCVLCDRCFQESDHAGHEVFFHRTTPGGCCDCGDVEAWDMRGMCGRHRPPEADTEGGDGEEVKDDTATGLEDDFEAVRSAGRARAEHERHANGTPKNATNNAEPQPLPPRLAAALAVVIGSVVQSVLVAADGAAIGADVSQWRLRWADEICKLWNGCTSDEEYYRRAAVMRALAAKAKKAETKELAREELWAHPKHVLDSHSEHYSSELPANYRISLRLHNDDVHTFDDVIKALHGKSLEPIAVPVGGEGSVGKVGGAGLSGDELKNLTGMQSVASDTTANNVAEVPKSRSRSPSRNDMDISPPRRNRPRSSGASSPTWNRSPVRSNDGDVLSINRGHGMQFASEVDPSAALVPRVEAATELTKKVDMHGQVLVRPYETLNGAGVGFARLRSSAGLHCSVSTTAHTEAEERAMVLLEWLSSLIGSHPAVGAMVVQALVDVTEGEDVLCCEEDANAGIPGMSTGVAVWSTPRTMPCWSGTNLSWWTDDGADERFVPAWRRRLEAFPPHLESSYLTGQEGKELFRLGMTSIVADQFIEATGVDPNFYADVPYSLPDSRLRKSPHALWGTLPASHISTANNADNERLTHPLLNRLSGETATNGMPGRLQQPVFVLDTDLRKYEEGGSITASLFPHKMAGLNVVSGASHVDEHGSETSNYFAQQSTGVASIDYAKKVASCSSFAAPTSPVLLLLLLDPYSPKQLRSALHRLFLSLLTDSRFKSRFAACLGAVAYRPTSSLFCAGIGTEADTLLGFTVQLFTTGSLVKALGNLDATRALLCREDGKEENDAETPCVSALPIAHAVVRSIHSNILGATREVSIVVKKNESNVPPTLVYQFGSEHPLSTRLPGAPDDKFIDSRCMKHKRLSHLLRDLEYIYETPGTAVRLLRSGRGSSSGFNTPSASPTNTNHLSGTVTAGALGAAVDAMTDSLTPAPSFTSPVASNSLATYKMPNPLDFPTVWARLLRLGQGVDLQKRKISGGHVEFEDERWLGAYGLSLNLSSTGDALSESPFSGGGAAIVDGQSGLPMSGTKATREVMSSLFAALFREIKMWLYREGLLETGLSRPASRSGELEALQRSTLHITRSLLDESSVNQIVAATGVEVASSCEAACEKGVKNLPEAKLVLLEAALLHERTKLAQSTQIYGTSTSHGPVIGDWLKVPHSPLAGESFSFHLPLHRALARSILCLCSAVVPKDERVENPNGWWRLPLLDDDDDFASGPNSSEEEEAGIVFKQDSLSALVRPTHRSSNFRVVWSSGPECSPPEASLRRSRSRMLSALLASTKVVHSLCDHPLRCIAAAQQIDHHMWARNGGSTAGMSLNYGSVPLCRSLRDLDLALVQLSASGFNVGLGARRVFSLLTNRFSMDGYLCDPDRRSSFGKIGWARPPRMQEPEHAEMLAESFFTTLCVVVSDLPAPPPSALDDDSVLRRNLKRELLHALAVEPRSHSEAMNAASAAVSRRDESDGGAVGAGSGASSFRAIFTEVLQGIGQQRNQGSRATGPPMFDLKPEESHEYDPSFYHLRKTEHQHAMDNIARLRRQKLTAESKSKGGAASAMVLPLVASPPEAHPRFMASRLLLHLPSTYAAIRRYLMYVLFNGSWLPPSKPEPEANTPLIINVSGAGDVAAVPGSRVEAFKRSTSTISNRSSVSTTINNNAFSGPPPFSPETVAASSKSFLEVLHILTLQVHTLDGCSSLHGSLPFLDHEQKALSSSIDINSYLAQLVNVPDSLLDVWALRPAPDGPLPSAGSGENRGSVLGLLVALYEHRDNAKSASDNQKSAGDDHGGARVLSADGLKWLLRLVDALADGAENIEAACQSATSGVPIDLSKGTASIHPEVRDQVKRMLTGLPELWPGNDVDSSTDANSTSAASEKSKEAQRAAKARALAKMKKLQSSFAASIASQFNDDSEKKLVEDTDEESLCIICKCEAGDGESGPMGYLGHVQRSRVAQLASKSTLSDTAGCGDSGGLGLDNIYRVVGDKGCQLRSTESMESAPVAFLPRGSIVEAIQSKMSSQNGLMSRRVLVRHIVDEDRQKEESGQQIVQGWASIQSSQGYVILSPLSSLCYTNTRWGPTRPIVRQCGHAAHLRCVEAHCLSLHQRSAGGQPFDGRFSANIDDGEFLCPLCKQLSNIVIPEEGPVEAGDAASPSMCEEKEGIEVQQDEAALPSADVSRIRNVLVRKARVSYSKEPSKSNEATRQFGASLAQAMQLSGDSVSSPKARKEREFWHPALRRWDFEDDDQGSNPQIGSVLRLMRQQLISWAAVGHSAAAVEASTRGSRQEVFGEVVYSSTDPWSDYNSKVKDSHPMLLDLRRMLIATASLFAVMTFEAGKQLGTNEEKAAGESAPLFGSFISDILEGQHWMVPGSNVSEGDKEWPVVTSIVASMMCHISKEDTIAPRLEARAVAAAMWTITGSTPPPSIPSTNGGAMNLDASPEVEVNDVGNGGNQVIVGQNPAEDGTNTSNEPRPVLPPKPLSVYRVERNLALELDPKWGALDPFKAGSTSPFRPAVASAFLYVPLLAWDMNILAGAVFSSLLSNANSIPSVSCSELLQSAKVLLVGRLIQVLSTGGFLTTSNDSEDDYDDFDDEQVWDDAKKQEEANAVKELLVFCRKIVTGADDQSAKGLDDTSLLKNVGNAILPFGRSLILLLRASSSAIRHHRRNAKAEYAEETQADKTIAKLVEDSTAMSIDDGFQLLDAIGAPLPSSILKTDAAHSSWHSLVTRWLTSLVGFEAYHGTSGKGLIFDEKTNSWIPSGGASNNESRRGRSPSLHNLHVETSAAAVEVAPRPPNGEDANPEDDNSDLEFEEVEAMEIADDSEVDSDEELENVDMDVDFDDAGMNDFDAAGSMMLPDSQDLDVDDASDAHAALSEPDGSKIPGPDDRMFSYVSRSAIIPYQPSILGMSQVGPGPRGARGELFEYKVANRVMKDLSHLGSIHVPGAPLNSLAKLPKSFVELYSMVNRVKGLDSRPDDDDSGVEETAICLLTGAVMPSGRRHKARNRPGTCTLHARKVGSGIGVFFLVQKCTILLMHNNKSAYSPSLYVDEHGEEDVGLRRGRPLFFSEERYQALEALWRTHGIPREVSQIRSTSDRVIRDNWY